MLQGKHGPSGVTGVFLPVFTVLGKLALAAGLMIAYEASVLAPQVFCLAMASSLLFSAE